jgi:splicing factor 45
MGLAEKLLKKMGWREGEGLGRNRQGISTPLMAQKRGDRAGVIVNAPELPRPAGGEAEVRRGGGDQGRAVGLELVAGKCPDFTHKGWACTWLLGGRACLLQS